MDVAKFKCLVLGGLFAGALFGCAESTLIRTNPAGATLYVNDRKVGTTPVEYTVPRDKWGTNQFFRLELEGYSPIQGQLPVVLAPGRLAGALFTLGLLYTISSPTQFSRSYYDFTFQTPQQIADSQRAINDMIAALREMVVTTGSVSQSYKVLGPVHVDTIGLVSIGAAVDDALRAPLARALQASPKVRAVEMNDALKVKAVQAYGREVNAVINVSYETHPDGNVFADGLAVHFTPSPMSPSQSAEDRIRALKRLFDEGLIDKGDFERKRTELLKEL